jgi:hypothetical protein
MLENTEVAIKQDNLENTEGAIKQNNLEKLVIKCTQDEEKQNKCTTQYVLETTMHKQTQIT